MDCRPPSSNYLVSENILHQSDLANYCTSKDQVHEVLTDACPATKGKRKYTVPLARLWGVAAETGKLEMRRQVEGISEEAFEVPLPQEEVETLQQRHFNS